MMKKFTKTLLFIITISVSSAYGQGRLADWIKSKYNIDVRHGFTQAPYTPLSLATNASNATLTNWVNEKDGKLLDVNQSVVGQIVQNAPLTLAISLPSENGRTYQLQLVKVDIYANGFNVKNAANQAVTLRSKNIHYQGIVKGYPNSIAAMSFSENGSISGIISQGFGTVVVGKIENSTQHIIYNQKGVMPQLPFSCFTSDSLSTTQETSWTQQAASTASGSCKTITVYFECDYDLYTKNSSSIQSTVEFMSGVFNQVSLLYHNDAVDMLMSEVKVWNTTDPYSTITSTSTLVDQFRNTLNGNFNGHIAHFISGRISQLGGGIAYAIPTQICTKANQCCVSAIYTTYSQVPTYSWTVNVITHEMGHILGSRHTHWCGWVGGPIDGCAGYAESDSLGNGCATGPIPSGGGTIMSYCHQQSVGINLSLGFGTQPGNIIRYKIAMANCVPTVSSTAAPTNLVTNTITGKTASLQWGAVSGAILYIIEYKPSSSTTWIFGGSSTTTTKVLNNLNFNTAYEWRVRASCSDYSTTGTFTTLANELYLVSPLPFTTICKNNYVTLNYVADNFLNGNQITIQLSDANGSFASPTTVGAVTSNTSGVISANIPSNVPNGTGYRLRLRSSAPLAYSSPTEAFTVSGDAPANFVNFTAANPSDNSFRIWVSADQPSKVYYVVAFNNITTVPTATQIINGLVGTNLPAIKSGSFDLLSANTDYHKIVSDLPSGSQYVIFLTLDNFTSCQKPIIASTIATTGTNVTPTACIPILDCTDDDYINSFSIAAIGLSSLNTGCSPGGYANRTSNFYTASKGVAYPFTLTTGYYSEHLIIWIDSNRNGTFESTEIVYQSSSASNSHTGNITVPTTAQSGILRMRAKVRYGTGSLTDPCDTNNYWGEAEDFYLFIPSQTPCPSLVELPNPTYNVTGGIGKIYRGQEIKATNVISNTSAAEYYGTKSITLEPGFTAENGSLFKAVIDSNCGSNN